MDKKKPTEKSKPKKKPNPKKTGRPKYVPSEEHIHTAYIGAKKGLSHKEIAKAIGIALSTLDDNMGAFSGAIKKGRDESDDKLCERVENSLLKKAEGFYYEETVIERRGKISKDGKFTGESHAIQRKYKKYMPPSDTAIFFFLTNRKRDRWKHARGLDKPSSSSKGIILQSIKTMVDEALT